MESQVTHQETKREWFTQMPNVITRLLKDPYLYRVYAYLREIAGEEGNCTYSVKTMSETCGMSDRKFLECKKILAQEFPEIGMPLIHIKQRFTAQGDRDTDTITILDIWMVNSNFKKERKFSFPNQKIVTTDENLIKNCDESNAGGSECSSPPVVNEVHSKKRPSLRNIKKEIYKEKDPGGSTQASSSPSNKAHIVLDREKEKFEGISQEQLEKWMRKYSNCNVIVELEGCLAYYLYTGKKHKVWELAIAKWLNKANNSTESTTKTNIKLATNVQKLALSKGKTACFETPKYIHPPKYRKIYFDEPVDEFKAALYEACNLED